MRLNRVDFSGYKRLRTTGSNFTGQVIALLGPNEAGKSSVLEALQWLSLRSGEPLEGRLNSYNFDRPPHDPVVVAEFVVEPDDLLGVASVRTDEWPKKFTVRKYENGARDFVMSPEPIRPELPFADASSAASLLRAVIQGELLDSEWTQTLQSQIEHFILAVDSPNARRDLLWSEEFSALEERLSSVSLDPDMVRLPGEDEARHALSAAEIRERVSSVTSRFLSSCSLLVARMDELRSELSDSAPIQTIGRHLERFSPEFLLFGESDRDLQSSYDLRVDEVRDRPSKALRNLLSVAGTSLADLWDIHERGNITQIRTKVRRCNERLDQKLAGTWRQARLSIEINLDSHILEVLIVEKAEDGNTVAFRERSDGLRMYMALMCFLANRHADYPIILLVDEAETHLHLDAQADLVRCFYELDSIQQVIYTTHSPGCLPRDLGTGIRLVRPDSVRSDASTLESNFWQGGVPGYSPLLYAMGAGAAAFSACRAAVVAEGPADMILLPTLIRLATGNSLEYQVAPGLSSAAPEQLFELNFVAAQVVYLVDGDAGGDALKKKLMADGVPEASVLSHANGHAVEDLIEPGFYLSVVRTMLNELGHSPVPSLEDIEGSGPVSSRFSKWAKANSVDFLGKVAIAARLVQQVSLESMPAEAVLELQRLNSSIVSLLSGNSSSRET